MSGVIGVSPDMRSGVIGKYPAGKILQMFNIHSITQTTVAGGGGFAHVLSKTFNRIKGNSHFICHAIVVTGTVDSGNNLDNTDPDYAFLVNGSVQDTYPALSRDAWYYSTVPAWRTNTGNTPGDNYGGGYDSYERSTSIDITGFNSGADNDSVTIIVRAKCEEASGFYLNRCRNHTNSGAPSSLTIYEIAA